MAGVWAPPSGGALLLLPTPTAASCCSSSPSALQLQLCPGTKSPAIKSHQYTCVGRLGRRLSLTDPPPPLLPQLRGARIKYREYISAGKGRDMTFDSISAFEMKTSSG